MIFCCPSENQHWPQGYFLTQLDSLTNEPSFFFFPNFGMVLRLLFCRIPIRQQNGHEEAGGVWVWRPVDEDRGPGTPFQSKGQRPCALLHLTMKPIIKWIKRKGLAGPSALTAVRTGIRGFTEQQPRNHPAQGKRIIMKWHFPQWY